MRRLTRLTNAFSKKLANFEAAVALHFAYYNFVRMHKSLRMTPAMAGGVTNTIWSSRDLGEAAYGWNIGTGSDARYTAVLEIPPVDSPNTAVRVAIAASVKESK